MTALVWILPVVFSLAAGIFLVNFLTAHPLQMSRDLFIATLALFGLAVTLVQGFDGTSRLLAGLAALAFFCAGYWLRTRQVLGRADSRFVPELARAKGDPGDGHTAVIYFTHGEPETYNPIGWLNQFREFDEGGIPFVPYLARPMFIYRLRNAYLRVGASRHRQMHIQMLKQLEKSFQEAGYSGLKFYLSFLDDEPRPDAAAIQALNEGASRIVVAEVFISISNHTAEGENLIKEVHAEECGVPVLFTRPLWDSVTLQQSFVERANSALDGASKSRVGVLLVGHGQPDQWDVEFPTETEHELCFREEILRLLEKDGYPVKNISLAWMEFKKPHPAEKVEELVRQGVERILYFAAGISAESIHSQYDIPRLVNKARVPSNFPLINLGAWNDHPLVIQAIRERIEAAMK